jgi:predicted AlkP superfamily phosphohydrolase/phosphomutase
MDPESVPVFPVTDQEKQWLNRVIENYYIYLDEVLGQYLRELGPDGTILVVSDHGFQPISKDNAGDPELSGEHELEGILFCKGPAFRKGYKIPRASIYDFLPTLLHISGIPVADDMKGKVLTDAILPEYLSSHPVKRIKSYGTKVRSNSQHSPDNLDEEIRQELRSLGYIQ